MEFLSQNTLYIVLIISLMIWAGIAFYLFRIDNKITKLEKMFSNNKDLNDED
jgi:CcmD family protein